MAIKVARPSFSPSNPDVTALVKSLTDESAAGWAIAKARLKIIEEQATVIEQLESARALNGAEIARLRGILSAFVRTARLKSSADGWCNIVAPFPVFDEMRQEHESTPTDLIEAIEAAEQRLLRIEGWRQAENDTHGGERWEHPKHGSECRMVAISMARKAAKKGSAQQP